MSVNVDDVISAYMTLRSRKESIEAEAKEKVASVKEKMAKLEAWIKTQADAQGVTSFKTKHGTAFLTTVDYASVADWDSLLGFIKEREAYDLRASNKELIVALSDALDALEHTNYLLTQPSISSTNQIIGREAAFERGLAVLKRNEK